MRKKQLFISVLILIVVVFASCSKVNVLQDIENASSVMKTEKAADESLPLFVQENDDKSQEIETIKTTEEEVKTEEKTTDTKENADDVNNLNENVTECTLSVRCDTILNNMDKFDKSKISIMPKDGIIFPQTKVIFYAGESAFNVLSRELKKHGIHIDFVNATMYNTVYIKGISNLYEHDCGELSGWIYKVNGIVPGYGCSQYILNDGDNIEFVYTCDLGRDIN